MLYVVLSVLLSTPSVHHCTEKPMPPPLTEEQYTSLNTQERYGACYHYCKEANQMYVDEVWRMLEEVDMLTEMLKQARKQLQQYQQNVLPPPSP